MTDYNPRTNHAPTRVTSLIRPTAGTTLWGSGNKRQRHSVVLSPSVCVLVKGHLNCSIWKP